MENNEKADMICLNSNIFNFLMHCFEIYIYIFQNGSEHIYTFVHTDMDIHTHSHPEFTAERRTRTHMDKDYPMWLPQNGESIGVGL